MRNLKRVLIVRLEVIIHHQLRVEPAPEKPSSRVPSPPGPAKKKPGKSPLPRGPRKKIPFRALPGASWELCWPPWELLRDSLQLLDYFHKSSLSFSRFPWSLSGGTTRRAVRDHV